MIGNLAYRKYAITLFLGKVCARRPMSEGVKYIYTWRAF